MTKKRNVLEVGAFDTICEICGHVISETTYLSKSNLGKFVIRSFCKKCKKIIAKAEKDLALLIEEARERPVALLRCIDKSEIIYKHFSKRRKINVRPLRNRGA